MVFLSRNIKFFVTSYNPEYQKDDEGNNNENSVKLGSFHGISHSLQRR